MGEHKRLPKRPSEKEFAREKKGRGKKHLERQLLKLDLEDESVFFKLLFRSKISFLSKKFLPADDAAADMMPTRGRIVAPWKRVLQGQWMFTCGSLCRRTSDVVNEIFFFFNFLSLRNLVETSAFGVGMIFF